MRSALGRSSARLLRRLMLCSLLVAVPLYGLAGTIVALLGPAHYHRDTATSVAVAPQAGMGLVDFRRATIGTTTLTPLQRHELWHREHPIARHSHARADTNVVTVDGAGTTLTGDGAASFGSACLTLATCSENHLLPPSWRIVSWAHASPTIVATRSPEPLDHPPKA